MSEPELGVSDFGISAGGPGPGVRDEPRRGAADDARFDLAARGATGHERHGGVCRSPTTTSRPPRPRSRAWPTASSGVAGPGRRARAQPDPVGDPQEFFPTSPVIGFANPVAPPVVVEAVDGELRGTAFFDYQYEGPPTCVHGGVIAMVFDEMLGAANIMAGSPAMTGTLTIKYRKPTPLRTPLRLEARFLEREGRKVRTYGAIFHGDDAHRRGRGHLHRGRPPAVPGHRDRELRLARGRRAGPSRRPPSGVRRGLIGPTPGCPPGGSPGPARPRPGPDRESSRRPRSQGPRHRRDQESA